MNYLIKVYVGYLGATTLCIYEHTTNQLTYLQPFLPTFFVTYNLCNNNIKNKTYLFNELFQLLKHDDYTMIL